MTLTISDITCETTYTPLKHPFVTAQHTVKEIAAIGVTINLENGLVGHGAATANEVVTGDTLDSALVILKEVLKPRLLGQDLSSWEFLLGQVHSAIKGNGPAKAACEIALYDLRAQLFQVPLYQYLGGFSSSVATDFTIGIGQPEAMVKEALEKQAAGFKSLKIKVGGTDIPKEVDQIKKIAQATKKATRLRIDANQAWNAKESLQLISQLENLTDRIDFIEQPVKAYDIRGLKQVTENSAIPIMADESVFSAQDALNLLQQGACDYINIKLMKTGGLSQAEKINQLCELYGINCMVGCMIESASGIAAAAAFAAAHQNVKFADLDSVFMAADAADNVPYALDRDSFILKEKPGLGF
ncbi:dipeptide epimerase [Ligilactobacillus pobuzihii]|uniref:dipeptide epimerase n=1 Tax=Ligilactobacillus pobuzihii TaxID=449659 RepID=UPI0019D2FE54|nr:dipeptide epimerase [Ligilactobacillus pobuzihii]MBN7274675.1 dipeptide epimerase [Ligilactobacillus pobuzihii]